MLHTKCGEIYFCKCPTASQFFTQCSQGNQISLRLWSQELEKILPCGAHNELLGHHHSLGAWKSRKNLLMSEWKPPRMTERKWRIFKKENHVSVLRLFFVSPVPARCSSDRGCCTGTFIVLKGLVQDHCAGLGWVKPMFGVCKWEKWVTRPPTERTLQHTSPHVNSYVL